MKKFLLLLLCVAAIFVLTACGSQTPDFREARWGMSRSEVTGSEDTEYVYADDQIIMYLGSQGEFNAEVYYEFEDGALVRGNCRYGVSDEVILEDFITEYERLRTELCETYGEPLSADYRIYADGTDASTDHERYLIFNGLLTFYTEWATENGGMTLTLAYEAITEDRAEGRLNFEWSAWMSGHKN